ncbi:MAG: PBSX family phage terminase large subunit [Firmicutes bacterium]|nr:PBSX family phage terminase large subunit [Bacillota bacterium]
MKFKPFSSKQLRALTWWCDSSPDREHDAIICDGAVRSGKTVCMSLSFIAWAFYRFGDASFAICGRTLQSLRRNVITPLEPMLRELGFDCRQVLSRNYMEINRGNRTNRFYLFGGKDESSAALIQGMTLSGVMFDEVALMPRSFVEQALARCSVEGSKFWFNCNPEHPEHWFKQQWIDRREEKNALYLHFCMNDNPSLSRQMIERYRSLYSDTFYERFVEGKWVSATGLVYPFFKVHDRNVTSSECSRFYISCDYGTVNPTSMGLWGLKDSVWYRLDEYYYSARQTGRQLTDEEHYSGLKRLAGNLPVEAVICDPSAASFITVVRRHGKFRVIPAKNSVIDGIRHVADALKGGKIAVCPCCKDAVREFGLYRWDDHAGCDAVKKDNDHAMDDIRYFVSTVLQQDGNRFFAAAVRR